MLFARVCSAIDILVEAAQRRTAIAADEADGVEARGGVRVWVGRVPEAGDYDIEVVRLAGKGSQLLYTLTVSLR